MGVFSLLIGAFKELLRDPKLFIPKMISVTVFIPPYLALAQIAAEVARNPAAAQGLVGQMNLISGIILLMMPIWIFIDSMYPVMVRQRAETGRISFGAAAAHVFRRFLRILLVFIASLAVVFIVNLPFTILISFGVVTQMMPLAAIGVLGIMCVMVASGILLYFVPTTVILEKTGAIDAFKSGYSMSRGNFFLVFWLTLFSLGVLLLGFLLEGAFEGLGAIGFVIGRYVGGIVTVYLYVINPTAYLEVKSGEKPAAKRGPAKKRKK